MVQEAPPNELQRLVRTNPDHFAVDDPGTPRERKRPSSLQSPFLWVNSAGVGTYSVATTSSSLPVLNGPGEIGTTVVIFLDEIPDNEPRPAYRGAGRGCSQRLPSRAWKVGLTVTKDDAR